MLLVLEKSYNVYTDYKSKESLVDVSRSIYSISEDEALILFSNDGFSDSVLPQNVICLIPMAKEDSDFYNQSFESLSTPLNIKSNEIEQEFLVGFSTLDNPQELIIAPRKKKFISYHRTSISKVKTQNTTDVYNSYCNVLVNNSKGLTEFEHEKSVDAHNRSFIPITPLDVFFFQETLRKNKEKSGGN